MVGAIWERRYKEDLITIWSVGVAGGVDNVAEVMSGNREAWQCLCFVGECGDGVFVRRLQGTT